MFLSRLPVTMNAFTDNAGERRARSLVSRVVSPKEISPRTAQILSANTPGAKPVVLILVIVFGVILFLCFCGFAFIWLRRYRRKQKGADFIPAATPVPIYLPPVPMVDIPAQGRSQTSQQDVEASWGDVKAPTVPAKDEKSHKKGGQGVKKNA